jgi:hypothetical protein
MIVIADTSVLLNLALVGRFISCIRSLVQS